MYLIKTSKNIRFFRERVSGYIPRGHRQSLDDDARGGLRRLAPTLTPPRRVIIFDAPEASLRGASIASRSSIAQL